MKVSIIGTGYVGLVTGVCLAEKGHHVICVDIDREKIDKINSGIPPIFETGLDELLVKNLGTNLYATLDLYKAVLETDITMIAVGTPFDGKEIDLKYIRDAACQIGAAIKDKKTYHLVVVKSTVVPGTTDEVVLPILEQESSKRVGVDFGVSMNPEFLTEGVAVRDFMFPDRIVVGGIDQKSVGLLEKLYSGFEGVKILKTNNKTAEMIKYASNALLATMISFSNEIGNLCAALGGIDVVDVMNGVHLSNYLNVVLSNGEHVQAPITSFLEAGCGFGGSCLPKDVKALIAHGEKAGRSMQLLEAVIDINKSQYQQMIALLEKHFYDLKDVRVTILGLSFKPDTDDMRESPAIPIILDLLDRGVRIQAYDPIAMDEARRRFGNRITFSESLPAALKDSQAIILVTRWQEFERIPEIISQMDPQPILIDGRRLLDKNAIARYEGIGV
jgi:UDPglucose 6-dehydrogenase